MKGSRAQAQVLQHGEYWEPDLGWGRGCEKPGEGGVLGTGCPSRSATVPAQLRDRRQHSAFKKENARGL